MIRWYHWPLLVVVFAAVAALAALEALGHLWAEWRDRHAVLRNAPDPAARRWYRRLSRCDSRDTVP